MLGCLAYEASKAAVNYMTQEIHIEFEADGLGVFHAYSLIIPLVVERLAVAVPIYSGALETDMRM
jgi:NAD(P)-dependent dehydrogenase (short-subunit alcohol dehydrogenase family)